MARHLAVWLILVASLAGCSSVHVEAGFKTPAELTATAQEQVRAAQHLGKIAYVQSGDIWTRELPNGKPRRLTEVGRDSEPRWSPSGQWLAFREDNHVWIERADGTDAHVVEGGVTIDTFTWSPVADELAYTNLGGLSVETADGKQRWVLVRASGRQDRGVGTIAWSPDGQWLAFDRTDRERQGLWRVPAHGGPPQTVYREAHPLQTQSYLVGWSPDGQNLLFWQGRLWSSSLLADGAPLLSIAVQGGRPQHLTRTLLHRDFLSWSPSGTKLALISGGGRFTWNNKTLAVAGLTGSVWHLLAHPTRPGQYADLYPAWSPDGHRIAITRGPVTRGTASGDVAGLAVEQRHIWLVAADGSAARQLTRGSRWRDERPLWSVDGSSILFVRLNGKFAELWLMHVDGTHQRRVAAGLLPAPFSGWWGYYGYVQWDQLYDWWTGRSTSSGAAS